MATSRTLGVKVTQQDSIAIRSVGADHQDRPGDDVRTQLERRREAALRLPPLTCGCRDPLQLAHLDGHCRYGQRAAS